jgi:hypothetical protein
MWPHRSHILPPPTAETGAPKKGIKAPPFKWTPEMQKVFEEMKALMAAEQVLCAYPDHNKPFEIYTDVSNYQLGACIMQDERPVAYYSRKLNSAQCNYATIDKELLCVAATLREFQSMLLGAELHIYTDHKNILNVGNSSKQRLRWISHVDEYGPTIHFRGPTQCYCGYIFKAFTQRCALNLSGEESHSCCQQLRVRVIIFVFDRGQRDTSVFLKPPMLLSQ